MSTSTTIKKFFTDFDAEEAWLNQMSAQGKELVNYRGGTYTFTTSEPHAWQYAIEILGTTSKESRDYLSFLEDMGIETVSTYAGRAYLRKKDDGTPFVLHNDLKSRLTQAQKANFWPPIIISQLFLVLAFCVNGILTQQGSPVAFGILTGISIAFIIAAAIEFFVFAKPYRKRIRQLKQELAIKE